VISVRISDNLVKIELEQKGYSILKGFASAEIVNQLLTFYYDTVGQSEVREGFFTTHWSSKYDYRIKVNRFVQKILLPELARGFSSFKCLLGYFLFKAPSSNNSVYMHQDWTLIDETRYTGYILWIPLIDTNIQNGCFHLVPGSHKVFTHPRGSNMPQKHHGISDKDFLPIPANAGDAIIFDQRLLHASPPNFSDKDRVAAGLIIVPSEADVIHYFYDEETGLTSMNTVNDSFLTDYFYDYEKKTSSRNIKDLFHTT